MESERLRYECSDTLKQRMIPGDSDKRLTNANSIGTTSIAPTLVSLSSLLPPTL